jgi:hypothetical protein
MIKFFNRLSLRIRIFHRSIFSRNIKKYTSNELKSSAIFRKLINHPNSILLIAPLSQKRYIKNKELGLFIILSDFKLNITNHVYNYDIDINWGLSQKLQKIFDEKVEISRIALESEIESQVQHSLHKILNKVS